LNHYFVSSRRRHTMSKRDWSSDVCSSDLMGSEGIDGLQLEGTDLRGNHRVFLCLVRHLGVRNTDISHHLHIGVMLRENLSHQGRSEERRVGKDCTLRRPPALEQQTNSNKQ